MFWNQFGIFVNLDPDSDPIASNIVDPGKINPDPHHWFCSECKKNVSLLSSPSSFLMVVDLDLCCFSLFWQELTNKSFMAILCIRKHIQLKHKDMIPPPPSSYQQPDLAKLYSWSVIRPWIFFVNSNLNLDMKN